MADTQNMEMDLEQEAADAKMHPSGEMTQEENISEDAELEEDSKGQEGSQAEESIEEEEVQEDEGTCDSEEEDAVAEKKGFFKKKEKKNKQEEKIAELTDRLQRQMAEFDNFRKRTEKEKAQMFEVGAKSVIEKILPVVDNFERGLASVPEDRKEDPIAQGMDKIYKQLMTELENLEVKPIDAVGKEFNPDFHNAVMQVESEEYESGMVAQELQKGYIYRETVVRHSMVSVVQ
jgi:molecular chaperone GrpE